MALVHQLALLLLAGPATLVAAGPYEFSATATYTSQPFGKVACGYGAKLPYASSFASTSPALFNNGASCGGCYSITCDSTKTKFCKPGTPTVNITVANLCAPGSFGGHCDNGKKAFTLQQPLFLQLASSITAGVIPVGFLKVPCVRKGGVTFTISTDGSQWYLPLIIENVNNPGVLVAVQTRFEPGGPWVYLTRSWGAVWVLNGVDHTNKAISIRAVAVFQGVKKSIIAASVLPKNHAYGVTYTSNVNF